MSGKWTPGPWGISMPYPKGEQDKRWIFEIYGPLCETPIAADDGGFMDALVPNALLIAAAPELADALEAMVERFGHDIFTMPPEDRDLLTRAVEVLAKAKGEGA